MIKDKKNPHIYVYEGYFIEKLCFNETPGFGKKGRTLERGILKTRKF